MIPSTTETNSCMRRIKENFSKEIISTNSEIVLNTYFHKMKQSILLSIFICINLMDASPIMKRRLYAVGFNYGALPTLSAHPYQPYFPTPVYHAASYGTPIVQAAAYRAPLIQAGSYAAPIVPTASYGSPVIQGVPITQAGAYGAPIIGAASMTKYIAVPKYLRIPLNKYADPWKVGHGVYLPKYYHSVARS